MTMTIRGWLVGFGILALTTGCAAPPAHVRTPAVSSLPDPTPTSSPRPMPRYYTYRVINVYPHDPSAFTQGLVFDAGQLYESTGLWGRSSLRRVALETGVVLQRRDLTAEYFGEGLALFRGQLFQLTWQNGIGFIYDADTFELLRIWRYETEGWGLTHDGAQLIMSDGSATLRFLNPDTLSVQRTLQVTDRGRPVDMLNELEYVNGEIFANVWQTDWIVRIDPSTGMVTGWVDLSGLLMPEERLAADVLNGIAYDPATQRLFVTGKLWPKLFEIALVPRI
jgi:glutamine cyclotransferase